ncbi:MAG: hypothetical protein IT381_05325 [Deltaproteobacteria bacterium]|nr:hypothetical protein [Deltaproteobacteria bacterium]
MARFAVSCLVLALPLMSACAATPVNNLSCAIVDGGGCACSRVDGASNVVACPASKTPVTLCCQTIDRCQCFAAAPRRSSCRAHDYTNGLKCVCDAARLVASDASTTAVCPNNATFACCRFNDKCVCSDGTPLDCKQPYQPATDCGPAVVERSATCQELGFLEEVDACGAVAIKR